MKKFYLILLVTFFQTSPAQFHHGISFQKTNKGNAINYTVSALLTQDVKYALRAGFHIESPESGFSLGQNNSIVEVPLKQVTYLPFSGELNYTFFRDAMASSFLPIACVELGTSTGLGKFKNTFTHHYHFNYFWSAGFGAEFSGDRQKYQVSARYFQSKNLIGNIMLDFTFFWR